MNIKVFILALVKIIKSLIGLFTKTEQPAVPETELVKPVEPVAEDYSEEYIYADEDEATPDYDEVIEEEEEVPEISNDVLTIAGLYVDYWNSRRTSRNELLTIAEFSILPRQLTSPISWIILTDVISQHGINSPIINRAEGVLKRKFKSPVKNFYEEVLLVKKICELSSATSSVSHSARMASRTALISHYNADSALPIYHELSFLGIAPCNEITITEVIKEKYHSHKSSALKHSIASNTSWTSPVSSLSNRLDPDDWFIYLGYGEPYPNDPSYGRLANKLHSGIDLNLPNDADLNKPIYAINDGSVVFAGTGTDTWGNIIVLRHVIGNKVYCSRYTHLAKMNVVTGQRVSSGDYIGNIGTSNGRWQAHLHFDIGIGDLLKSNPSLRSWWLTHEELNRSFVNPHTLFDG